MYLDSHQKLFNECPPLFVLLSVCKYLTSCFCVAVALYLIRLAVSDDVWSGWFLFLGTALILFIMFEKQVNKNINNDIFYFLLDIIIEGYFLIISEASRGRNLSSDASYRGATNFQIKFYKNPVPFEYFLWKVSAIKP